MKLAGFGWATLNVDQGCVVNPSPEDPCSGPGVPKTAGYQVTWGTLDGVQTGSLEKSLDRLSEPADFVRAEPRIFWRDRETLMISSFDGRDSILTGAPLKASSTAEWWQGESPVQSLVSNSDTGAVFVSFVDPKHRGDLGIWLIPMAGATPSRLIAGRADLADRPAGGSDAGEIWTRDLRLTPDGSRLVAFDCVAGLCDLRVIEIASTTVTTVRSDLRREEVYGLDDAKVYGLFDCNTRCKPAAIDLSSGAIDPLPIDACGGGPGTVVMTQAGGPVLVLTTSIPTRACGRRSTVVAVDLATGAEIEVFNQAGDLATVSALVVSSVAFAYTLPPASVLVGPASEATFDGRTMLLSLVDRSSQPVLASKAP